MTKEKKTTIKQNFGVLFPLCYDFYSVFLFNWKLFVYITFRQYIMLKYLRNEYLMILLFYNSIETGAAKKNATLKLYYIHRRHIKRQKMWKTCGSLNGRGWEKM